MTQHLTDPRVHFWFTGPAHAPDGMVFIEQHKGEGFISDLYVRRPGWGFGKALLDRALTHARERRFPKVACTVFDGNHGAMRFFEREGFSQASAAASKSFPGYFLIRLERDL
jgi:ribosomal protein S18 acetylase RimI-like enzyme